MTFLRLLFLVLVVWWIARALGRWILGGGRSAGARRKREPGDGPGRAEAEAGYGEFTDQRIEDAEYEEIDTEGPE